jgi:hypothetical protein
VFPELGEIFRLLVGCDPTLQNRTEYKIVGWGLYPTDYFDCAANREV